MADASTTSSAHDSFVRAPGGDAGGTHLFDVLVIPPARVVRRFGEGDACDEYKVSRQYVFRKGPLIFTLYDWKSTDLYDAEFESPESFWATEELREVHIGSKEPATKQDIAAFAAFVWGASAQIRS